VIRERIETPSGRVIIKTRRECWPPRNIQPSKSDPSGRDRSRDLVRAARGIHPPHPVAGRIRPPAPACVRGALHYRDDFPS